MKWIWRLGIAAAVLVLAAGAVGAAWFAGAFVERRSLAGLSAMLAEGLLVHRPAGAGEAPLPTVLAFLGCGGVFDREGRPRPLIEPYAAAANAAGWQLVVVDSFAVRGLGYEEAVARVCSGWRLRGRERAGDVVAALALARGRADVDGERIVLAGWSHGAWAVMDALSYDLEADFPHTLRAADPSLLEGLAGVFLVYPYCGLLPRAERGWAHAPARVRVVAVEGDEMAPPEDCAPAFRRLSAEGLPVAVTTLSGATHAFDEPDNDDPSMVHSPAHTAASVSAFAALLAAAGGGAAAGGRPSP